MSIDIIIQARLGSKRLPKKVLMNIGNKTMLGQLISRIKKVSKIRKIIIATSTNKVDDEIISHCEKISNILTFRGSEKDVLERYYKTAVKFDSKNIIRVTGDCPMIDPNIIEQIINLFLTKKYDYVSNSLPKTFPDGLDCEIFTFEALKYSYLNAKSNFSREHVTPFIRGISDERNKRKFLIGNVSFFADFSKVRWTVDYEKDLKRVRKLFELLPENFSWLEALSAAIEKPKLLGING